MWHIILFRLHPSAFLCVFNQVYVRLLTTKDVQHSNISSFVAWGMTLQGIGMHKMVFYNRIMRKLVSKPLAIIILVNLWCCQFWPSENIFFSSLSFNVRIYLQILSHVVDSLQQKIWMVSTTTTQQCIIFVIDVSLHIVRVFVWFYRDFSYRNAFTPHTFHLNELFI